MFFKIVYTYTCNRIYLIDADMWASPEEGNEDVSSDDRGEHPGDADERVDQTEVVDLRRHACMKSNDN